MGWTETAIGWRAGCAFSFPLSYSYCTSYEAGVSGVVRLSADIWTSAEAVARAGKSSRPNASISGSHAVVASTHSGPRRASRKAPLARKMHLPLLLRKAAPLAAQCGNKKALSRIHTPQLHAGSREALPLLTCRLFFAAAVVITRADQTEGKDLACAHRTAVAPPPSALGAFSHQ